MEEWWGMRGRGLSPPEFPARLLLSTLNFCTFSIFLSNPMTFKKESFSVIEKSALSQILHMIIFPILLLLLLVSW